MDVSISLLSELRFSSTVLVFASETHFYSFSLSLLSDFGVTSYIIHDFFIVFDIVFTDNYCYI